MIIGIIFELLYDSGATLESSIKRFKRFPLEGEQYPLSGLCDLPSSQRGEEGGLEGKGRYLESLLNLTYRSFSIKLRKMLQQMVQYVGFDIYFQNSSVQLILQFI